MTSERDRLIGLIDYVEATERDRLRIVTDVAEHRGFRATGEDIIKLPGVIVDIRSETDHIWLSVERLARILPPSPGDAELALWIVLPDDVDGAPSLKTEVAASVLHDAGSDRPGPAAAASATLALSAYPHRDRVTAMLEAYRREVWAAWVIEERPRRRAIALYNGLFALRQSLDGGGETPVELVWGIGPAAWTRPRGSLRHPLLTVAMELAIDERSHAIQLRPRSELPPGIESDPLDAIEAPAVDEWRQFALRFLDGLEGDGLSPFVADSFAPVLRRAVALCDADGHYLPDRGDRPVPQPSTLQVGGGWLLFERTRRATTLMDDLRRFRTGLAATVDPDLIPPAVRALLVEPDDAVPAESYPEFRGVSTVPGVTSSEGGGADLFFPKPFNREQVEVIQRLAGRPGVVVQGPPGTGKTHSIANIISHYLALGKRVLVTSQKAPALKVLRAQLPAAVRPLAVSLLDSDRDGLKQFQESVDIIAERLHRTRPAEVAREIVALDARIDGLHRALAEIDRVVDGIGRAAMAAAEIDGVAVAPAAAARELIADLELSEWLPDAIDVIRSHDPEFDDAAITTLREARKAVGACLCYLGQALPPPGTLPDGDALLAIHAALAEAERLRRLDTPDTRLRSDADEDQLAEAEALLARLAEARTAVERAGLSWTGAVLSDLRGGTENAGLAALADLAERIDRAAAEARHFLTRPVVLPDGAGEDQALRDTIAARARGDAPGLLQGLFARATLARLATIRFTGHAPRTDADWAEVVRYLAALDAATALEAAWNHAAGATALDPVATAGLSSSNAMQRQLRHVAILRDLVERERAADALLRILLPGWRRSVADDADATAIAADLLDRHRRRARLANAQAGWTALRGRLRTVPGAIGAELRDVADTGFGDPATDEDGLRRGWTTALAELETIRALAPRFDTIRSVTQAIEESGAPVWANRLRLDPVPGVEDPWTPGDWRTRWRLRRLSTWLARIDAHAALRDAHRRRTALEHQLRRAYEEAIELRTWCRLAEKASDQVRAALAAYAQAMRRLGRGTGIKAGRYRQDARAAADRAKNALPCWIMPHYRVSESLPAELGLFDLVIVDEASQSTLAALPALLRAKQVLIVGDDRQVTPDAGFREEARMNELADRHLGSQVPGYRAALREEKSLYDLGTVVFAGGAIMLKEHFRCVAPIIEYSKAQFYSHQLVPLRLPSASERLDPPLIDILVEDGYRRGKVNPAEVDCIVEEIGRIVADPAMAGRSIGVTTLLGHEQAAALFTAIERVHGTEAMLAHDIRVGEPSAFQGDERDIMFVSMVAVRGSGSLSGAAYDQRFNVAASRARDRMILVRSVEPEDLKPADQLRRALIEHFRVPFAADGAQAADRRARCESGFETEMFDLLAGRGYRVDTQVRVGTRRIDLVVEGENDRRLAIECDGDAYHGPDQWPDDMARQRMLERAGWTVWRCFASRFVRDRAGVVAELVATLAERDIHPLAGGAHPPSRHSEHRRWRTCGGDPAEAVAEPVIP